MPNRPVAVPDSVLAALREVNTFGELWACYRAVLAYNHLKPSDVIKRSGVDENLVRNVFHDHLVKTDHYIPIRTFTVLLDAIGITDTEPWTGAYAAIESTGPGTSPGRQFSPQQVFIAGENAHVNVSYSQQPAGPGIGIPDDAAARGELQARYYFRFLGQSLTQATVTFVLSMLVATAGMAIVLVGASLAVIHANEHASTVIPVLTSVAGLAVTTCGGAMAVQANKARAHATEQAENVRRDMNSDQAFDRATTLISKVNDPILRDRLFAITSVNELGLSPNPIDLAQHLAPGTQSLPTESPSSEQLESGNGDS
ncbi:TRADD-N-associated membrane domain-containing protein [Nocardia sp. R7R-8]|uniref:TRADD-N-associated membrane domain-containing protein n=1 Tax=Nocardia sp. R7R-8 TaxID=3459304 RepID=UPI00403DBB63